MLSSGWHDKYLSVCLHSSVLDLNAFERQNKAEGLGMVTEEGSGMFTKWEKNAYKMNICSNV